LQTRWLQSSSSQPWQHLRLRILGLHSQRHWLFPTPPHHDANPKTGLVTLPEVITGDLAGKFSEIRSTTITPTLSLDPPSTRTRHPHGPSHGSRLLSHRVQMSRSTSTSHMASAMLAGPMRKLSLHAGLARRSSPTTIRTLTVPPATTRTPLTSSTLGRTLTSLSPRTP
jgi:hypothetical protein